jgi:quinoprotein dehydrogenase-associated probable ABC transporter substrate-binding protein
LKGDASSPAPPRRVLRVAADPNNLPFSNNRLEGFENRLAELIAKDLEADVQYVWRAQRRGFFRHAFKDDGCEVVLGVPAGFEMAATTEPYYRSTYVFVIRADRGRNISSFDDPALREMKIGIQVVGDEGAMTPVGFALARRGLANNVVGYSLYGDYREANPPARIVDAVAAGEVDVAVVWGPLAGYFAGRSKVPLDVTPVSPAVEPPGLPLAFDISIGVRKGEPSLKEELNRVLARRRADVERILDDYGVPRVAPGAKAADAATASVR